MHATSTFLDAAAVEAWDTWFRWREDGVLKDLSIDSTWRRVATFLAGSQTTRAGAYFLQSLLAAFSRWRLLLDERILTTAGTGIVGWPSDRLVAVLNAAAFVSGSQSGHARFEWAAFTETAELSVRGLSVAATLANGAPPPAASMRIGIIGLADAFSLLGMPYDSPQARTLGGEIGRGLARGCLLGALRAADPRNADPTGPPSLLNSARRPAFEGIFPSALKKVGFPYASLTAITRQPHLAMFANNVTDSIGPHHALSSKSAKNSHDPAVAMRHALQPWVHEPIDDPG